MKLYIYQNGTVSKTVRSRWTLKYFEVDVVNTKESKSKASSVIYDYFGHNSENYMDVMERFFSIVEKNNI